ncbi:2791_t:CDS:2, partial [Cetraspora pellucida]
DSITFRTNIMHITTIFDQTAHTGTGPLACYDDAKIIKYLSNSTLCTSTSTTVILLFQLSNIQEEKSNAICTLRQEKFNNNFTLKDLLNSIQKILSLLFKDMSNDKGLLDCLPIYSFLFLNEKGSSLYNAYDRNEVEDKLVIKIDQDANRAPKFSVANDISEVYSLPGIHECINGQKPLRAVINIDASKEDMETAGVKGQEIKALRKNIPFSIIHNTYQPQKGKMFHLAPNKETMLAELWDWAKKDLQGIIRAIKTDFPEL